jgi:UPF0755 protein
VLLISGALVAMPAVFHWGIVVPADTQGGLIEFEVHAGQTVRAVATQLEELGMIRSAVLFEVYARATGRTASIRRGEYALSAAMSARDILESLVSGKVIDRSVVVTVPEGWTLKQIAQRLEARNVVDATAFMAAASMRPAYRDLPLLAGLSDDQSLEGYLFPESYRFEPGSPAEVVVRRMVVQLEHNLPEDWMQITERQHRNLHQVLTLASIVQAEAFQTDIEQVAGVFWNRLRTGRRLESDATVNYALGTSKRQPTFADTYVQHPYNTYRFSGLPPGPIGSPGRSAIAASLHPPDLPYFFFLHKVNGEIVLSRTFAEHLSAKARYLD